VRNSGVYIFGLACWGLPVVRCGKGMARSSPQLRDRRCLNSHPRGARCVCTNFWRGRSSNGFTQRVHGTKVPFLFWPWEIATERDKRTQLLRSFFSGSEEQPGDCFSDTLTQWPVTKKTVQIFEEEARIFFRILGSLGALGAFDYSPGNLGLEDYILADSGSLWPDRLQHESSSLIELR
jgi:hypothetical protein